MQTFEELIDGLKGYLESHAGAENRIKKAAKQLAGKEDAQNALNKLLPALSNNKISVFFSYKKKDEEAAVKIVNLLRKFSAGRLEITFQAEFTSDIAGRPYRKKIIDEIKNANWFILLFPDPQDDWDWCLYEAGFFAAQFTSADRLICLHHSSKKPSPIEDYQMVAVELPEVEKFLRMAFLEDNPIPGLGPVNTAIENDIEDIAVQIVHAIRRPQNLQREIYEPWVELHVIEPEKLYEIEKFDKSLIVDANKKALEIFGLLDKKSTWQEFRENLAINDTDEGANRWLKDLIHVIRKISNGHTFYPVQSVFQNKEGKMYRPVVCAVDRDVDQMPKKIETFHLTFTEDVASVDRSAMPKDLSVLANVLRSTFRFRWEVLEKFSKGPMTEDDIERLQTAFVRIKQDWDSRSVGGQEDICRLFPGEHVQHRLSEMFSSWYKVKNDEETGELDVAMKNKDIEKIPGLLKNFLPMNSEFLEMAADRFAELVTGK